MPVLPSEYAADNEYLPRKKLVRSPLEIATVQTKHITIKTYRVVYFIEVEKKAPIRGLI
jgi:hypothetical protein